jgi:hypothetical protein
MKNKMQPPRVLPTPVPSLVPRKVTDSDSDDEEEEEDDNDNELEGETAAKYSQSNQSVGVSEKDVEEEEKWFCEDCRVGSHYCHICKKRGLDNQVKLNDTLCCTKVHVAIRFTALQCCFLYLIIILFFNGLILLSFCCAFSKDVFKCNLNACGKYYHKECLELGGSISGPDVPFHKPSVGF